MGAQNNSKKIFLISQLTKFFQVAKKKSTIAPAWGAPDLSVVCTDGASLWELKLSHILYTQFFRKIFQHTKSVFNYPYGPAI